MAEVVGTVYQTADSIHVSRCARVVIECDPNIVQCAGCGVFVLLLECSPEVKGICRPCHAAAMKELEDLWYVVRDHEGYSMFRVKARSYDEAKSRAEPVLARCYFDPEEGLWSVELEGLDGDDTQAVAEEELEIKEDEVATGLQRTCECEMSRCPIHEDRKCPSVAGKGRTDPYGLVLCDSCAVAYARAGVVVTV